MTKQSLYICEFVNVQPQIQITLQSILQMLTMAMPEHNDLVIMPYNTLGATELRVQTKLILAFDMNQSVAV